VKTKTQVKNTNLNRSRAMKESWAKRRNSPMRELARKRVVTQRVTPDNMLSDFLKLAGPRQVRIEEGMAQIRQGINEIRSMMAQPPSNGALAHSVEVSKRLEDYKQRLGEGVAGIYRTIKLHVDAFDDKLAAFDARLSKLEKKRVRK